MVIFLVNFYSIFTPKANLLSVSRSHSIPIHTPPLNVRSLISNLSHCILMADTRSLLKKVSVTNPPNPVNDMLARVLHDKVKFYILSLNLHQTNWNRINSARKKLPPVGREPGISCDIFPDEFLTVLCWRLTLINILIKSCSNDSQNDPIQKVKWCMKQISVKDLPSCTCLVGTMRLASDF